MLTLIQGSDTVSSRNFFIEQKKAVADAVTLQADTMTITDLAQLLEGGELFLQPKHIFIEQLFTKKKKGKDRDALLAYLTAHASDHAIYLWEDREVEKSITVHLKNTTIKDFRLPQSLFALLDSLKPGNTNRMINLFHQTLTETEVEMIFYMLVRQFRLLLAMQHIAYNSNIELTQTDKNTTRTHLREVNQKESTVTISELKRIQPWQKSKIEKQARLFGIEHLKALYVKLYKIELAQKTGTLNGTLTSAIDFFMLAF